MTNEKPTLGPEKFYELGPGFPNPETYPEEEEFEWYRNSGLTPDMFDHQEPEFAKRYAAWLKAHPLPADA